MQSGAQSPPKRIGTKAEQKTRMPRKTGSPVSKWPRRVVPLAEFRIFSALPFRPPLGMSVLEGTLQTRHPVFSSKNACKRGYIFRVWPAVRSALHFAYKTDVLAELQVVYPARFWSLRLARHRLGRPRFDASQPRPSMFLSRRGYVAHVYKYDTISSEPVLPQLGSARLAKKYTAALPREF